MKRFLIILLFPSLCFGAFTEFYMQSGGSNLNAGSTNNNTATYTSTSGNWTQATRVFTPTDGSTPASTVNVGDFASVYLNAASVGVFIGRITAVGAGVNGTITLSGTAIIGAAPANSTGGMSIKVGGAWLGPNGSTVFPFLATGGNLGSLLNTSNDHVRVNAKNDQTYTMTATLPLGSAMSNALLQGYSSSVGDLGKATFTSNITSANNFTVPSASNAAFADIIFANTGGSNSNHCVDSSSNGSVFLRCVFKGARGAGFNNSGGSTMMALIECEAYDDNKSNTASLGGISTTGGGHIICINTYSHDHASGSNAHGYVNSSSGGAIILINSIADTVAGSGVNMTVTPGMLISLNSDFYNNTGDAIKFSTSNQIAFAYIANNNFIKNAGKGVNNTLASQTGVIYNNGRGAGTEANGSSDTLASIINPSTDITYASNVNPYTAPTTGNFSINLAAAQGVGRGVFTETDGTNTGTVGYPDVGAAQAQVGATFPTPTPTSTPTPTPTPPPETSHTFGG